MFSFNSLCVFVSKFVFFLAQGAFFFATPILIPTLLALNAVGYGQIIFLIAERVKQEPVHHRHGDIAQVEFRLIIHTYVG